MCYIVYFMYTKIKFQNTYDIDKEFIDIITKRSLDDITDNLKT